MQKRPKVLALLVAFMLLESLFIFRLSTQARSPRSSKIRRTILLNFKPEASQSQIEKIFVEVRSNVSQLKGVHNVFTGAQVNERATFKYGISMDFDDAAALKAYRADQEHRQTHNKYNHLIEAAQITDIRDD